MKKSIILCIALVGMLILSGCSFGPFKSKEKSPLVKQGSIWKSGDGGSSFEPKITLEAPPAEENTDEDVVVPAEIISADILDITFHPDNSSVIYTGTVNDGIFKTVNGGETWKHIDFPPQKIYSFTLDRNDPDNRMFASGVLYGTGKIFRTEDGGANWKEAYSEPGSSTTVTSLSQHNSDTNVIFAGTSEGTVIKSTDAGQTWKNIGQKIDGPVTAMPFDAEKSFSLYALLFKKKVYYSEDGGENWIDWEEKKKEEMKELLDRESKLRKDERTDEADKLKKTIDAIKKRNEEEKMPGRIVSVTTSPFISGTVYAGTQDGRLYESLDYGKYWNEVNIIESANAFPIRMVTVSYSNKNEISFISGRAFYKSLNGGESWAVVHLNVDRPVSVISYDPNDSNVIYLGLSKND